VSGLTARRDSRPGLGDMIRAAPLADMTEFVSSSAERAGLQVATVEVEDPAEILRLGFERAGTRGVGGGTEPRHRLAGALTTNLRIHPWSIAWQKSRLAGKLTRATTLPICDTRAGCWLAR
jgi:hypothetical protein